MTALGKMPAAGTWSNPLFEGGDGDAPSTQHDAVALEFCSAVRRSLVPFRDIGDIVRAMSGVRSSA
jgi:hypothetical protein